MAGGGDSGNDAMPEVVFPEEQADPRVCAAVTHRSLRFVGRAALCAGLGWLDDSMMRTGENRTKR